MTAHPGPWKPPAGMANERRIETEAARQRYRIVVRGRLSERFAATFSGMTLEPGNGETALVGDVRDQSQLYGLLDQLRDFGLELVSIEQEAQT
jgi:hypothetical protein